MTRSLKKYHMGCGETLLSSCWQTLLQRNVQCSDKKSEDKKILKRKRN